MAEDTRTEGASADVGAEVRTFLIADVRGYTRFTQEYGDEAGARLAARFATVVRECVVGRSGQLLELRGDEALCVFGSPRAAVRCAVELQRRCVEELRSDPSLPLRVGVGIDAGEAVSVEGGYRGGALNLAARLCSIAKAGQVLVSEGVVLLARRVEECSYVSMGRVEFKGLREPVRYFAAEFGLVLPEAASEPRRWTSVRLAGLAVAVIAVIAAVVAVAATRLGTHHPVRLESNVVAVLSSEGQLTGQVALGGRPGGVAAGAGGVWATDAERGAVVEINPRSGSIVDTIPVGAGSDPSGVAVGGGGVWVADGGSGQVSWMNASSPSAQPPIVIQVGPGPGPIAYGDGAAWVVNTTDATLQRISAKTLQPSAPIAVGGAPSGVAVGGGWVWVTDASSSSVVKVDPKTLQVVARLPVGNDPVAVAYGGGMVWVANAADGTVTRLDPTAGRGRPIPVGRDPSGLVSARGQVWVAVGQPPAVARIDSALAVTTTPIASTPQAAAVADGRVWVTALASPASHRGGTLRVVFDSDHFTPGYSSFDPAVAPYLDHWQVLAMTHDGLVTYRRVGGAAGLEVVPDLAVAMPTISPDGRTYTFQLRRGIHYSNGRLVHASDFRSSLVREFQPGALSRGAGGYYQSELLSSITGYAACHRAAQACTFTNGIQTNDQTETITIHLTHRDPAFLLKLATTFGDFVAPGSPPADSGKPVPGTGPYTVGGLYNNGKDGFLLVHNPHFHEWSADAQPNGYPSQIRWTFVPTADKELNAVEDGTAGVMADPPPTSRLGELRTRYAALAHPYTTLSTTYLSLNTRVAPFNHLAARQAVNLAFDRNHIVDLLGGSQIATPTCQVLPPGMFGYSPYCPYTINPTPSGAWTAPNLAKAEQLVRSSHTRGDHVVIWTWGGFSFARVAPYLTHVLTQLGYHATTHTTPPNGTGFDAWNAATQDSRRHATASLGAWYADYPNPTDFFDILLTCKSFTPADPNNPNSAEFCDPRFDHLVHAAEAVQTSDPARAAALWHAADHEAVTQAPWVPLYNDVQLDVIANRVGNYQHNPEWSMLLDQLWVR